MMSMRWARQALLLTCATALLIMGSLMPAEVAGAGAVAAQVINSVSCATVNRCEAVGAASNTAAVAFMTTDGGSRWSAQRLPRKVQELYAVTCPSSSLCEAAAGVADGGVENDQQELGAIAQTADGGGRWAVSVAPFSSVNAVACGTASRCVAVGYNLGAGRQASAVYSTGAPPVHSWAVSHVPLTEGALFGAACPTAQTCVAVGDGNADGDDAGVVGTTDGGANWRRQTLPAGVPQELVAVACPTPRRCVAVGGQGPPEAVTTANGGSSWERGSLPPGPSRSAQLGLTAVSCPTAKVCYAVGNDAGNGAVTVLRTVNGGSGWEVTGVPSGVGQLMGISCPSAQRCIVVGAAASASEGAVAITLDGGAHWREPSLP